MSRRGVQFAAAVVCLLGFLGGRISAAFWRPSAASLPSNPNDPYYQTFQTVPSASVTASKLMINFLHIYPVNIVKRQGSLIEDIVVVMDGSGSIGVCEFGKGKKALQHTMKLASAAGSTKYAAVTFASSASVNFKFLPYSTAANEMIKIPYPSGSTNTQAGLTVAKKLFDDPLSGRRVVARKLVFLVTDGQSNTQSQLTIPKAQELKNIGVQIYVVAVGNYIYGIDEMVKVASYPPEQFLFRVKRLSSFWEIIKLIIKQVSPGKYAIVNGEYDPPC